MSHQELFFVCVEGEIDANDWIERLLTAQKLDAGLYRHQAIHYADCPVMQGQGCNCSLVSMFSSAHHIVLVDQGLQTYQAALH